MLFYCSYFTCGNVFHFSYTKREGPHQKWQCLKCTPFGAMSMNVDTGFSCFCTQVKYESLWQFCHIPWSIKNTNALLQFPILFICCLQLPNDYTQWSNTRTKPVSQKKKNNNINNNYKQNQSPLKAYRCRHNGNHIIADCL